MAKTKYNSYAAFAAVYGNIGITEWVKYNYLADYVPPSPKKYILQTNTTPVAASRVFAGIKAAANLSLTEAKTACGDIYGKESGDFTEIIRLVTGVTGSTEDRPFVGIFGAYDTREEAEAVLQSIQAVARPYFEIAEVDE